MTMLRVNSKDGEAECATRRGFIAGGWARATCRAGRGGVRLGWCTGRGPRPSPVAGGAYCLLTWYSYALPA